LIAEGQNVSNCHRTVIEPKEPILRIVHILIGAGMLLAALAPAAQADKVLDAVFSEVERRLIYEYYQRHGAYDTSGHVDYRDKPGKGKGKGKMGKDQGKHVGLPPGLAKRKHLPPGLAKRSQLPPGLAKRNLPTDLNRQLPPVKVGYERAIVDDSVVLVHIATGMVLDILTNAVSGHR
jgi:hypothetical protein